MTPQVNITSPTTRGIIASLRSPCAKNSALKRGYSQSPRHLGQVHVFPDSTEAVIAPGTGVVTGINSLNNTDWGHAPGTLDTFKTFEVVMDHGAYVTTHVRGMASVNVAVGQYVVRGEVLGYPRTAEIFFQLFYRNSPLDPAAYSSAFRGFDSGKVIGKGQQLRSGPDLLDRPDSGTVSYVAGDVRYFVDELCHKPALLVNIDFNGSLKTGLAASGFFASDFWTTYNPVSFGSLPGDMNSTIYTADPVLPLRDFADNKSVVRLERVPDLVATAGGTNSFDPMLQNWVGGAGVLNGFRLTNIQTGTYALLLYAGNGGAATNFYLSANLNPYTLKTATPTGALDFVENDNYVAFTGLALADSSALDIRAFGFLAGLQLIRTN